MKTTLIFLACVLAINGAKLEEKCDRKALEIFREDCKHQCEVAEARNFNPCAMCIWKHKDYDAACKEETRTDQCRVQSIVQECKATKPNSDESCDNNDEEECVYQCSFKLGIVGLSCEVNLEVNGLKHDMYA